MGPVDLPFLWLALLYGLPFMALWYAPVYAWMLLVSAWARRVAFLWALAPLAAMLIIERLALHQTAAICHASSGGSPAGSASLTPAPDAAGLDRGGCPISTRCAVHPAGLWLGLALAALLLFAAMRLRRTRAPI